MKIKNIKIHNWRSIKDLEVDLQDITIFIGQNNHGKSNVLSSLLFFFGEINCTELDFKRGADELFVEVLFVNLDKHDKRQFQKYLTVDNEIKVRKQIIKGSTFEYHGYCEIPGDDWLKEEKIRDYTSRESVKATPLESYIPKTGRITKEMLKKAQQEYISKNKEKISFNYELETTNFLGLKSVAQGIFGDVFFIPAVKDASSEFSVRGKSVFNRLLSDVINEMSTSNKPYIAAKGKIKELTENLNRNISNGSISPERPKQITELENMIGDELKEWHTKIDIEITPPDIDEMLKLGTSVWVDDGVPTDVSRKGHGLQRALIFSLIKAWAKILKKTRAEKNREEGDAGRRASMSNYFIFEEPELYLHPQAQRELYYSLKELSEATNQVLLSTHSSSFLDLKMYKSICRIYKESVEEGTKKLQYTEELFSLADDKKNFNLTYWINPDRGELFFAKKVILVEGPTDKTVIAFLAKNLSIFKYEYTIIDCGSKDNIKTYLHLLNKFNLPYVAVYDKDNQDYKSPDGIEVATKSSLAIEDTIDRDIGSSVILDNDIEEEIGITERIDKNKPYFALQKVSSGDFVMSRTLKEKIERIYE